MMVRVAKPDILTELTRSPRGAVIKAHAGTGKTFTIEHLVVELLLRHDERLGRRLRIDEIVVVTFTEKATGELVARIRHIIENLIERSEQAPDGASCWDIDTEAREHLRTALQSFDLAPISTIHGFCQRVLKESAFLRRKQFTMEVVDGDDVFERAFRTCLRRHFAREHRLAALLRVWLRERDLSSLHELLRNVLAKGAGDEGRGRPRQEWEPIGLMQLFQRVWDWFSEPAVMEAAGRLEKEFLPQKPVGSVEQLKKFCQYSFHRKKREDWETIRPALEILRDAGDAFSCRWAALLLERISINDKGGCRLEHKDDPACAEALDGLRGLAALAGLRPVTELQGYEDLLAHLARVREPDVEAVAGYLSVIGFEGKDGLCSALRAGLLTLREIAIAEYVPVLRREIDRIKTSEGLLDFDDLLVEVDRALGDETQLAENGLVRMLRSRFRAAVIDEFQDTDPVQWSIFRKLFVLSEEHTCYLVGDEKQAIYSFRGADLKTYRIATAQVEQLCGEPVVLGRNFRSTKAMISAYNLILEDGAFLPAGLYCDPVQCGNPNVCLETAAGRIDGHAVELLKLVSDDGKVKAHEVRHALLHAMVSRIREILMHPDKRLTWVECKDDGVRKERPLTARDIYVLTPSHRDSKEVAQVLREYGIPHAQYKQSGLFRTHEAHDVLDVLEAILAPGETERLCKAWLTCFFGLTLRDLDVAMQVPETHELKRNFILWHEQALAGDVHAIFSELTRRTRVLRRELVFSLSERIFTNLLHVLELLSRWHIESRCQFDELVARLRLAVLGDDMVEEDADLQRLETEDDAVQIMTMHASKGLEAAVVFLYGGFSRVDRKDVEVVDLGPDDARDPVFYDRSVSREREEACYQDFHDCEERRLLYVAVTRAGGKLIVPLIPKVAAKSGETWLLSRFDGIHAKLNERLWTLVSGEPEPAVAQILSEHFAIREVPVVSRAVEMASAGWDLSDWKPKALLPPVDISDRLQEMRRLHAAPTETSYSRLKAEEKSEAVVRRAVRTRDAGLPAGAHFGNCVHRILERVELAQLRNGCDFSSWWPLVKDLVEESLGREGLQLSYAERVAEMVFECLTRPLALGEEELTGLCQLVGVRAEMEFLVPYPEHGQPLFGCDEEGEYRWSVERGYIRGFMDLVFLWNGRAYFADWKTDVLPSYDEETAEAHVRMHYDLQRKIYAIALTRMLGIRSEEQYEQQFGGSLYVFVRGPTYVFERLSWDELVAAERALVERKEVVNE